MERPSEEQLEGLEELAEKATPRPWYVRHLDDDAAMSLIGISTQKDSGLGKRFGMMFDGKELLAATLIQHPRYVSSADEKWHENAEYIVAAANALPSLIEEIRELRKQLEEVIRKKTPIKAR
jgi:hypothetical protein